MVLSRELGCIVRKLPRKRKLQFVRARCRVVNCPLARLGEAITHVVHVFPFAIDAPRRLCYGDRRSRWLRETLRGIAVRRGWDHGMG